MRHGAGDEHAMAEDLVAMPRIAPVAGDYDAICAALMQTERGRWFLEEYALRNRSADTKLLLSAVERIEAAVCSGSERSRQAQNGFRTHLLEMARAISQTQAEVAAIKPQVQAAPPRAPDVFAAAERIRDVTWAMRGHGFDPSTCDQLEELAGTILSASALRDPTDHRAHKLGEVLQYLERRISGLLDGAESPAAPAHDHGRTGKAIEPAPLTETRSGSAGPLLLGQPVNDADGQTRATSLRTRVQSLFAAHDDPGDAPLPAEEALPPHTINGHASLPAIADSPPSHARMQAEALGTIETSNGHALAEPLRGANLPINGAMPPPPAAREILPEIELPDFGAAEVLPPIEATPLPEVMVPQPAPQRPPRLPPAAPTPPAPTAQLPPQSLAGDPLAALRAMTEEELVALFT
jgi:hypothetical protein